MFAQMYGHTEILSPSTPSPNKSYSPADQTVSSTHPAFASAQLKYTTFSRRNSHPKSWNRSALDKDDHKISTNQSFSSSRCSQAGNSPMLLFREYEMQSANHLVRDMYPSIFSRRLQFRYVPFSPYNLISWLTLRRRRSPAKRSNFQSNILYLENESSRQAHWPILKAWISTINSPK